ncbi:MAG TPA: cyclopropane-fatty-acyl-phospholipid synthase family protein [Opitutaceae bacterium]|nr:cyclopropane-fatty-acyl-phospholipid synthase family protein [Opitutaceae bacterium]
MNAPVYSFASSNDLPRRLPLAQRLVLASLRPLDQGRLDLRLPDGTSYQFGGTQALQGSPRLGDRALIEVQRAEFFRKCLLQGDIGFAESYMDGDWDTPDLTAVIAWFILNREKAPTFAQSSSAGLTNLFRAANRVRHLLRPNSRRTAPRNIREHYDLSNEFFQLWLDPSMMYSGARWDRQDATLEEAQLAKNNALCRKLELSPTDHVLEIGTGWGGWSLHAAMHYGCRVTTLTLSPSQAEFARRRIAEAGLSHRVTVRLQDYRDLPADERYDKLVAIEMLEAVGHRYLPEWCRVVSQALKPGGLLALQYITCPDSRYHALRKGVDFIQKHIFPGSLLLSANRLNHLLAEKGGFVLHGLDDIGADYARTLHLWRDRFSRQTAAVRALGFSDRFLRLWTYYLAYCEAAFATRHISLVQTVHTRPNNLNLA